MFSCLIAACRSISERASTQHLLLSRCASNVSFSTLPGTFYSKDIEICPATVPSPRVPKEELGFGKVFTDHMLVIQHNDATGWGHPKITPFQNLSVHPAAQVFHYGLCVFEGMKAYVGADGRGLLFRPDMNMARFHRSIMRLSLADFDPQELLGCMKALLRLERSWMPSGDGYSMYIRPFAFASANVLGVTKPTATTISIILSPVGPYFGKGNTRGISLFLDEHHVRAWPGGAGDCKIGGNYAPTFQPQAAALAAHGTPQVMYTMPRGADPMEAAISECGAMNMFFVLRLPGGDVELVTPPLDGTILPGVTRDSIIQLARSWSGLRVSERLITVGEVLTAHRDRRLLEAFGAGTASVVQPVATIVRESGERVELPAPPADGQSISMRLLHAIRDIQHGRVAHPWSVPFE